MSVDNASDLLDQLKANRLDVEKMEQTISNDVCVECSSQNIDNVNGSYMGTKTIFDSL